MSNQRPPGWYVDPDTPGRKRWWNGTDWDDGSDDNIANARTTNRASMRGPHRLSHGVILGLVWGITLTLLIGGALVYSYARFG